MIRNCNGDSICETQLKELSNAVTLSLWCAMCGTLSLPVITNKQLFGKRNTAVADVGCNLDNPRFTSRRRCFCVFSDKWWGINCDQLEIGIEKFFKETNYKLVR